MVCRHLFKILFAKFVTFSKLCDGHFAFSFGYGPERKVQIETDKFNISHLFF